MTVLKWRSRREMLRKIWNVVEDITFIFLLISKFVKQSVSNVLLFKHLFKLQKQPPEVFCKIYRKTPVPETLRPATLFKKKLWHRCFPVNFAKFLETLFSTEHLWATAFETDFQTFKYLFKYSKMYSNSY